jgi:uncharacterized protein
MKVAETQLNLKSKLATKDNKQITEADWKFRQNASQFARQGYSIAGAVSAGWLERSHDLNLKVGEMLGAVRAVEKTLSSRPGFAVSAAGAITMSCQTCTEDFDLAIDSQSTIYVAHDAAELASWEDEAFECIEGNEKTSALELVEDELLLAVPYIPRCPKCEALIAPRAIEFN